MSGQDSFKSRVGLVGVCLAAALVVPVCVEFVPAAEAVLEEPLFFTALALAHGLVIPHKLVLNGLRGEVKVLPFDVGRDLALALVEVVLVALGRVP